MEIAERDVDRLSNYRNAVTFKNDRNDVDSSIVSHTSTCGNKKRQQKRDNVFSGHVAPRKETGQIRQ